MKKLILLCCFVINSGLLASKDIDFNFALVTVRNNKIVASGSSSFDDVAQSFFEVSRQGVPLSSDGSFSMLPKKFERISRALLDGGLEKGMKYCCSMSIATKFNQLFSCGQKAGCVIAGLVVIPLAFYGAYNLAPVVTKRYHKALKRYQEQYHQDEE